jgi:hypothetical protein
MLLGYWDSHGFPAMIPGSSDWNDNQQAIKDVIASPDHITEYAFYEGVNDADPQQWPYSYPKEDRSEIDPETSHAHDCLADYARCSWSLYGMKHGSSYHSKQDNALQSWTGRVGYGGSFAGQYRYLSNESAWTFYTNKIDAGIPLQFLVDTDANGITDRFVTAWGYDDTGGQRKYLCWDTWSHTPRWCDFEKIGSGQPWGIHGMTYLEPVPEPASLVTLLCLAPVLLRGRRRFAPKRPGPE